MDSENKFHPLDLHAPVKLDATHYRYAELTKQIIGAAIEVHRQLGPGFLESIYEEAFSRQLAKSQIAHQRQVPIRILFDDEPIGMHRLDLIVSQKVVVELKAVKQLEDVHIAICLSYLKAAGLDVGLIINFAEARTRIRRIFRPSD
jgi:GxxExxY protein